MSLEWYCKRNPDGVWPKLADSAFGAYTPCVSSLVISISHLVLCTICSYLIWLIKYGVKAQKFRVRSSFYYYVMLLLVGYCAAVPSLRLAMKVSIFNLDGRIGLPSFEIVSLTLEALAWFSMLIKIGLETKIYVQQYRWYVLFGVVYCVLGEVLMLNLVFSASNHHVSFLLYAYSSALLCQILLGCLLVIHTTSLEPDPGYAKLESESHDAGKYKVLSGENRICPERLANLFSRISFGWMTPLMQQGHKQPITGKDVWQLDSWDQTETLIKNFQSYWAEESKRLKPQLVRAIINSFVKRLLLAWSWKIGFDLCQLLGPMLLNHLLQSMQRGEPSCVGYVYAFSIFFGLLFGIICESQFYQNVMRVGLRVRSTLVAVIFRKSLRLTHGSRKNFPSGKITNLITTDATAIQEMCEQLHGLWSAPFRIILCMVLLYQQLGVASLLGTLLLALMTLIQTLLIRNLRKLKKEGLQRTDNRISLMSEVLSAMETVKFYAWEKSFQLRVQNIRDDELSCLRSAQFLSFFNNFILSSIAAVVTLVTFAAFTFLGGNLTPARAFTSLSLFQVLEFPLKMLPNLLTQVVNANVSVQRVEELLLAEQRNLAENPPLDKKFPAISIKNGYFSWDSKADIPTLSNINLNISVGSLVAIVGGTGEGKTSLLSAILGDLPPATDTSVIFRGTVAYVPQISWIFNATLRDNILFGSKYEPTRYWRAIESTALLDDLNSFPGHDLTEIGEKGVNISVGQRQRVSMARAVYSDSDVYIFDDPLSALDANVGRQVFNSCIKNALHGKTIILVTNQLHFLEHMDRIILMREGMIKEEGTFEELSKCGKLFQKLMENAGKINKLGEQAAVTEDVNIQNKNLNIVADSMEEPAKYAGCTEKEKGSKCVLIKEEERKTGTVSWNVLMRYKNGVGGMWIILILFTSFLSTMLRVSSSAWLRFWTKESSSESYRPGYYILIYALLSMSQVTGKLGNSYGLSIASLRAARRLHDLMLDSVLRAPMLFFHTNPTGRIVNRFSKDVGVVDHNVANLGHGFINFVWQLLVTFVLIGFVSTISLWAILPLLILFYANFQYFQSTMREVKRLESIARSPVYSQLAEALAGLSSIRAYKAYDWMAKINGKSMDERSRFTLARFSSNNWLTMRMGMIGGVIIWITAACAVMQNGGTESQVTFASTMGLLLTYTLKITILVNDRLRQAGKTEISLNSVERIGTYIDLPSEDPNMNEAIPPPPAWPSSGFIRFRDVFLRYRPELPPVLHGISFTVSPSEKLGIVGRTGAGKSSLLNALFRIVEIERGAIVIDGFDITRIRLTDMRRSLSIIPQSPVLFSGSVRFNLDPFNQFSEAELWKALERAHLKEVIRRNSSGLDAMVSEGGENFSVGQRQLLSLARALLKKSKILVLDEATAAIDVKTDALVQKTIREEFRSCTMLVVAHRLNTIMDCDKILLLHAGQIVEHGGTQELLSNEESGFSRMAKSTGSANAQYLRSLAFECKTTKHWSREEPMKQDGLKRRVVSSR